MAKAKRTAKPAAQRRPTGARLLKNRPLEEAPEIDEPKQKRLPTMEDAPIEELESAAERYASIRDRRQALTAEEVPLKKRLLDLMHSHKKTEYKHEGVEIKVLVEKEKVRVRIKKDKEEE